MLQATQESIEASRTADTAMPSATHHATRASRNGRAQVNYSAKYHPMDDTLRPKLAARVTGPRSLSTSVSRGRGGGDDETSDDSEPELLSDNESSPSHSEGETPASRKPDPRATRHSNRAEAKKSVNYSKSHHPQDYALPGFQHRAKRGKRKSASSTSRGKKATSDKGIVISDDDASSDSSEGDRANQTGGQDTERKSSPPRKRLKTHGRSRTTTGEGVNPSLRRDESTNNEMEAIMRGHHFAPPDDNYAGSSLISDATTAPKNIKDIDALMSGILEGVRSSAENNPEHGAAGSKSEHESLTDEAPRMPLQDFPANSLFTPGAQVIATPASLTVFRPYFALPVDPQPSAQSTGMPEVEKSAEKEAPTCEGTGKAADDENRLKQAVRDSSIEAARYANARETARRLSKSPLKSLEHHSTDRTGISSRQSSSGTLSTDNQEHSSFFDDALSDSQRDLQNGGEEGQSHSDSDLPIALAAHGYSGLPDSQQGLQNEDADGSLHSSSDLPDPSVSSVYSGPLGLQRAHTIDLSSDSAILQAMESSTRALLADEIESEGNILAKTHTQDVQAYNTISGERKQAVHNLETGRTQSPTILSSEMLSVVQKSSDE